MTVTKALIIKTPYVDHILSGQKTWELRTSTTRIRGPIALIRKGSGTVVGTVDLVDSLGPFTETHMLENVRHHLVTPEQFRNGDVARYQHAWVLANPKVLPSPIPYAHPAGAVIWVNLEPEVVSRLGLALAQ